MIILGSTGSIGKNAAFLATKYKINVTALACEKNYEELNRQIDILNPKFVYIKDEKLKRFIRHNMIFSGDNGIQNLLKACKNEFGIDTVINSLVGFSGLLPSKISLELGFKLALANKESLVVAGKFLDIKNIIPIDSEHFGLRFLLKDKPKIKELIITASGGPFHKLALKYFKTITPKMALNHPNWNMGSKITIDSATMTNKLFEVLEAFWLFNTKNIRAVIEKTSLIHALIHFCDGSSTAHLCKTDMKLAIASAMGIGNKDILPNLDLLKLAPIKFESINLKKYPIFSLKDEVLSNPNLGVVINAANEVMVYKFLSGQAEFLDISHVIFLALDKFHDPNLKQIEDVFETDLKVREYCKKVINGR